MVSVEQTFLVWSIHDVLLHYKTLFEQCCIARHFNLLWNDSMIMIDTTRRDPGHLA